MIRRMFKLCLYAAALTGGGMIAWAAFRPSLDGSGVPATEDRAIGDVTEVTLSGVGDLTVVQGEVPGLRVTADDNILPVVESEVHGTHLTLRTESVYNVRPKTRITYTLTVRRLDAVSISGAGNLKADKLTSPNLKVSLSGAGNANLGNVTCKTLNLTLSGAGTATVSGTAETATMRISGAGDIDAAALKTASADLRISGAGNATIWATDTLKARVSGAGGIKYKGTPKVEKKVSGAGSVKPLSAEK